MNPHNLLAAAFLVLVSLCTETTRFRVEPKDGTGNDWIIVIHDGWRFDVFMDVGEPDYMNGMTGPGGLKVIFHPDPEKAVPPGLDAAWDAIFTNLIRMSKIAERVTAACRVHPDWPFS